MYYQPSLIEYKLKLFSLEKILLWGNGNTRKPLERENCAPKMIQKYIKREIKNKPYPPPMLLGPEPKPQTIVCFIKK